jgi:hypothetical protein
MKLTYNNSVVYPDNATIKWLPNYYHEGFVDGKLMFRAIDYPKGSDTGSHQLMMYDPILDEWEIIKGGNFHNASIYCEVYKTDKDKANKYSHYHSLHACHQLAEDLLKQCSK